MTSARSHDGSRFLGTPHRVALAVLCLQVALFLCWCVVASGNAPMLWQAARLLGLSVVVAGLLFGLTVSTYDLIRLKGTRLGVALMTLVVTLLFGSFLGVCYLAFGPCRNLMWAPDIVGSISDGAFYVMLATGSVLCVLAMPYLWGTYAEFLRMRRGFGLGRHIMSTGSGLDLETRFYVVVHDDGSYEVHDPWDLWARLGYGNPKPVATDSRKPSISVRPAGKDESSFTVPEFEAPGRPSESWARVLREFEAQDEVLFYVDMTIMADPSHVYRAALCRAIEETPVWHALNDL